MQGAVRVPLVFAVVCLLMSACSSTSYESAEPRGDPASSTAAVVADSSTEQRGTIAELLLRIPQAAVWDQAPASIFVTDYLAIAAARGVAAPANRTADVNLTWLTELETPVFLFPLIVGLSDKDAGEFGFSVFDIDSYANVDQPYGAQLSVFGRDLASSDALRDAEPYLKIGEGNGMQTNVADRTELRLLGRARHVAAENGLVAVSLLLPQIEAWLDNDAPSILDDPSVGLAARELDRVGVVEASFEIPAAGSMPAKGESTFDLVAVGATYDGPETGSVIVYVFDDEGSASAGRDVIEADWDEWVSADGQVVVDVYRRVIVEQRDRAVVVVASGSSLSRFDLNSLWCDTAFGESPTGRPLVPKFGCS